MDKLVERDDEEKTLARAYSECCTGQSRVITIAGSLASGKTALLDSFTRDTADAGATVLAVTATSLERDQPLGVIDQLLRRCRLLVGDVSRDLRALTESRDETGPRHDLSLPVLDLLHAAFERLVDSSPLIVCIDDAHLMDVESLRYLVGLIRRMDNTPASIVLTYCPDMGRSAVQRLIQAEILRMSHHIPIDVQPLSETGVGTVLEGYFDLATARRAAPECARLSGGRPLLVHALAEDYGNRIWEPDEHLRPAPGPAFARAVLSCLYRAEPVVLEIAQATALLGEFRSAAVVARLCGINAEYVARVAASPAVGGLLRPDLLGLPGVREAVLRSIPRQARHAMQSHAARLLHQEAAPALVTAGHLVRSDEAAPWAKHVLCEAADQALASGDHKAAISFLERAHRESVGRRARIDTAARLTDLMWRYDPAAARRYLPDLVTAAAEGELSVRQAVSVTRSLLWNGQVDQAARVMSSFGPDCSAQPEAGYADRLRLWLPLAFPGIATAPEVEAVPVASGGLGPADHRAAAALRAVLDGTGDQGTVAAAEFVLREALTGAASPPSSLAALLVLVYAGKLDKASVWCDALLASTGQMYGLVWNALFVATRAEIHYRHGDLRGAERQVLNALALMPRESWGAAIVVPLSLLILIATARGDLDAAERHLDSPVPGAAFSTLGGVLYLNARGHLHLAHGRHDAAVRDFLAAGHLMKLWKADCPAVVPWRVHAARAYLHKGLVAQARELLTEQMTLLPPGELRVSGQVYRALAETVRPDERPALLLRAANNLDRCGDSLNLAYTIADLHHAHESLGDVTHARRDAERARALADRCGAVLLPDRQATADDAGTEIIGDGTHPVHQLSSAELRVAELAARGSTNHQIARKLFITVSTVEQHLTRTYRKLGIRRRTQLSSFLSERV
ncbi:AAA family ATPase [Micromonospora sp. NPDC005686]|uniref:helix-turn-helix transcriptional regulator n=1 Tax=unclassified Micromonospora TaxID=2617518 RepID=UPI0033AC5679